MTDSPAVAPLRFFHIAGLAVLGAVTLLGFAAPFLPATITPEISSWLQVAHASPWAPIAGIAAFVILASVGIPQIVLIAALVAAFGPWAGLFYAWTGKMIACNFGFWVGRRFGAQLLARYSSPRLAEIMRQLAKRGFWASALIRLVPTAPSVLVNIAAGATPIRFRDFLAGTALGSIPKMALMAFGSASAMAAVQRHSNEALIELSLVIALWLALAVAGKRWLARPMQD